MANFNIADQNIAGNVFCCANTSGKSVIAVTTAMTGVILYNPVGSGKQLVVLQAGFVWTTAPAALQNIGLALAAPNATAPSSLTAIGSGVLQANGSGNASASVTKAFDTATLPVAPTPIRWMGGSTFGSAVGESPYSIIDYVNGAICLLPGAVLTFTVVTNTAVGMGSLVWAEVPYPTPN